MLKAMSSLIYRKEPKAEKARSTETVHTSAKARLTSVEISVLPSGESVRDCHQKLTICSLAHRQPSLQISCKSVRKLLRNVANRQIERQTNMQQRKRNLLGGDNKESRTAAIHFSDRHHSTHDLQAAA